MEVVDVDASSPHANYILPLLWFYWKGGIIFKVSAMAYAVFQISSLWSIKGVVLLRMLMFLILTASTAFFIKSIDYFSCCGFSFSFFFITIPRMFSYNCMPFLHWQAKRRPNSFAHYNALACLAGLSLKSTRISPVEVRTSSCDWELTYIFSLLYIQCTFIVKYDCIFLLFMLHVIRS